MKTETTIERQEPPRAADANADQIIRLALAQITESATNPRQNFEPAAMAELEASLKARGMEEPLLVRRRPPGCAKTPEQAAVARALKLEEAHYEIVDGARRFRAARSIRLDPLPARVTELTDAQVRERQLTSFIREGLNDLEEAAALQALLDLAPGATQAEKLKVVTAKTGKERSTLLQRLALLKLSPPVRKALVKKQISQSHASLLASIPSEKTQARMLKDCIDREGSVRDLKREIDREVLRDLGKATFDVKDAALTPAGACAGCEFRGENAKDKFPQLALRPQACLNPACFETKTQAAFEQKASGFRARGGTVLNAAESKKVFPNSWSDPQGGYTTLGNGVHTTRGYKSYSDLLGPNLKGCTPVLARQGDEPKTLYKESELKAAVKAKGVKLQSLGGRSEETKEAREKRLRQEAVRKASTVREVGALVAAIEKHKNPGEALVWVASEVLEHCEFTEEIWKRRGFEGQPGYRQQARSRQRFAKLTTTQLIGLLVEMFAYDYDEELSEFGAELCGVFKVDLKAIRKQVAPEIAAQEKKKTPPAAPPAAQATARKGKTK